MKIKEYRKHFGLDNFSTESNEKQFSDKQFNEYNFLEMFSIDFIGQLDFLTASKQLNHTRFKAIVSDFKRKLDAIFLNVNIPKANIDKIWHRFYATSVVKERDSRLGEEIKNKREEYRKRQEWQYHNPFEPAGGFDNREFLENLLRYLLNGRNSNTTPPCFTIMNLTHTANETEIKKRFAELAMQHHPDKGGNPEKFIEITMAKNECLRHIGVA